MLTSHPGAAMSSGWLTAGLPASAARLNGRRRVMTEVSDFSQKMGGQGPAGLAQMQATAAWQAACDVTDFTLYYGMRDRSVEDYRAYCDFVGRLNAILKDAMPQPEVLLYYPIYDLWAEYLPVAEPLKLNSQSPAAQRIVESTLRLGRTLQRSQIPFTLIDHEHLAEAQVGKDNQLSIGNQSYRSLILPAGIEFPESAATIVEQFSKAGGRVLRDGVPPTALSPQTLKEAIGPTVAILPSSDRVVLGRFVRDGREIVITVNVGDRPFEGALSLPKSDDWLLLDPAAGQIEEANVAENGTVTLELNAHQTRLMVGTTSVAVERLGTSP
jgi:hypothetical protein